ncbi:hypothetical protein Plhal304r1_c061g0148301 [Plasmopara halstedii]
MALSARDYGIDSEPAFDSPLPPPPPPPSPPQDNIKGKASLSGNSSLNKLRKRKDFREILALFHDQEMDASKAKGEWNALWTMMLTESQEDQRSYRHKEQHGIKRKKNGDHDHGIMLSRNLSSSLSRHSSINQDYAKRARQVATTSTDLSESGKGINSRQSGRFFKNASKGSKLMQKFCGRN